MASKKILLQELRPPSKANENRDLQWLIDSLLLSSKKDPDKTAYKIFKALVEYSMENQPVTSTELSEIAGVTRGAVLFHLQKFSQCGLIRSENRRYILRAPSLEETISSMMRDAEELFTRMRKIAAEIDKKMGYESRW